MGLPSAANIFCLLFR